MRTENGRRNIGVLAVVLVALLASGCASVKERIDLGDGLVFDLVPVGAVPGDTGKALKFISDRYAVEREARLGPFNGLPFTTRRTVILKDGTEIPEERIAKIVRTRTPVMPAPVVDVLDPADFPSNPIQPAPEATVPPASPSEPATGSPIPAPVQDSLTPEQRAALEEALR